MLLEKEMDSWLSIAKEAALKAGAYLLDSDQSSKDISLNIGKDVKITADVRSESIILDYLKGRTDFPILSEENGFVEGNDKKFTWIVDPLDGSLNYSRSIPLCCVAIGLWQGETPVLGAVYDFYRSELYTGIAGKGAWLNGKEIKSSHV
ncbi:MAG: inositol monophosphatase family protein, partial [Clostridiales bacterium]|nr:inositol monophosphatase family protein [Clostridiales bacterium]